MFGGGFFGKPVPMKGVASGNAVPMGGQGSPVGKPLGVVPQGQAVQVNRPVSNPAAAPQAGFQPQPLIPPTRVPMGKKGDCPICRG